MKTYYYMRLSTQGIRGNGIEQEFDRQKYIFKMAGCKLTDDNTFSDRITGSSKVEKRPSFNMLMDLLQEGDTIWFSEVSRFSRDYISGMETIDMLILNKKVNIHFVSDNQTLYAGKKFSPDEWLSISIKLLMSEFKKREVGFSTSNGIKARRELLGDDFKIGRPTNISKEDNEKIISDRISGMQVKDIAEKYKVSKPTVTSILKSANLVRNYNRGE